jgi:cytochrome c
MSGRESNKLAAGVLIAGLIVMITGKIVDVLYVPNLTPEQRGFKVEVAESQTQGQPAAQEPEFEIDIKSLMASASVEEGEKSFSKCSSCHTVSKGGPNRVGPNLWNIVGAKKAHLSDYNYSKALSSMEGEWTYENLAHFLHKPAKYVKGTKMSFAGIKKQEEISNIIAYLRSLSDSPKALP